MNKLTMESLSEIRGGSNAGYAIGRAIGSVIKWVSEIPPLMGPFYW